jgi:hypothetical protein
VTKTPKIKINDSFSLGTIVEIDKDKYTHTKITGEKNGPSSHASTQACTEAWVKPAGL